MSRSVVVLWLLCVQAVWSKPLTVHVENYLIKYGYMSFGQTSLRDSSSAVRQFQQMFGLRETGVVDDETARLMEEPRCGNVDVAASSMYKQQSDLWEKKLLKWTYEPTSDGMDEDRIVGIIRQAFRFWSMASTFRFDYVERGAADIIITFEKFSHGDGRKFDGPGNELAHAFFPWTSRAGIVHLDGSETWSLEDRKSDINLFSVITHELGHTLGLKHQYRRDSIMFPFYMYWPKNTRPSAYDKNLMRQTYKEDDSNEYFDRQPKMVEPTQRSIRFDTVGIIRGEPFMFFQDKFIRYFSINQKDNTRMLLELTRLFRFPKYTVIDRVVSVYDSIDGRIILIIGDRYYAFIGANLVNGFPKQFSEFGIHDRINHAIPHGRGYVYFIGEHSTYKFNEYTLQVESLIKYEDGNSLTMDLATNYILNNASSLTTNLWTGLLCAAAIMIISTIR